MSFSDGEVNEQVIPPRVWDRLRKEDRYLHSGQVMHKGNVSREFYAYADGVADALYMDLDDLLGRVREVDG